MWIHKEDRKITIIDATSENVEKYGNALFTDELEGIFVDYYNAPKTRAGQANGYESLAGNKTEGKGDRAYKWSLDKYPERSDNTIRYVVALYQQGYKAKNGKPKRTIQTTYDCSVDKLFINNRFVIDPRIGQKYTSPEGRGGRYFKIFRLLSGEFPYMTIYITHRSRGYVPNNPLSVTYPSLPLGGVPKDSIIELIMEYSKS